jgi:hypothetical protein
VTSSNQDGARNNLLRFFMEYYRLWTNEPDVSTLLHIRSIYRSLAIRSFHSRQARHQINIGQQQANTLGSMFCKAHTRYGRGNQPGIGGRCRPRCSEAHVRWKGLRSHCSDHGFMVSAIPFESLGARHEQNALTNLYEKSSDMLQFKSSITSI